MIITTKIFESCLICKCKTHLRLRGETALASEFDLVHRRWVDRYKDSALQILRDRYHLDSDHSYEIWGTVVLKHFIDLPRNTPEIVTCDRLFKIPRGFHPVSGSLS